LSSGQAAEIASNISKRARSSSSGTHSVREWQDKEGQKRTSFEIVASNFRMLGGRADGAAASAGAAPWAEAPPRRRRLRRRQHHDEPAQEAAPAQNLDEDIPF